jgi:hypothetical protein
MVRSLGLYEFKVANTAHKMLHLVTQKIQLHFFACGFSVVLEAFVKKPIFSLLNGLGIFVENQLT